MLTGPEGIGKATLAWRIARAVLDPVDSGPGLFGDTPAATLDRAMDSPAGRRVTALSEPALMLLRRPWDEKTKRHKTVIPVDYVRALKGFLALSRPDGGWRVVVVDSADEMNDAAANALLKLLEEPPPLTVFLLVSHQPARLLPTIRSRCRTLALSPLATDDAVSVLEGLGLMPDDARAVAALSGGSPGAGWRLHQLDGPALREQFAALMATMPGADGSAAVALAQSLAARGAEDRRTLFLDLADGYLADLARHGTGVGTALHGRDADTAARLAATPQAGRAWADVQQSASRQVRRGLAVNLDPHMLILDMVHSLDRCAARCAAA